MGFHSPDPVANLRPPPGGEATGQRLAFSPAAVRAAKTVVPPTPAELSQLAAETASRYANRALSPAVLTGWWRMLEFALLAAILLAALNAVEVVPPGTMLWRYAVVAAAGAVAGIAGIQTLGGYELMLLRRRFEQIVPVGGGLAAAFGALAIGVRCAGPEVGPMLVWLLASYLGGVSTLFVARLLFGMRLRRWRRNGLMERRAVIVGGGQGAADVIRQLDLQTESDIRICGIFDDRGDRRSPPQVEGYPKLGNIHQLVEFSRKARIDMLIVTLPLSAEKRVLELLKSLWVLPLDIRLAAHRSELAGRSPSYSYLGRVPLVSVFDKPIADWNAFAKRVFDLAIASLALVFLAPIFLATALAIRLDSKGPILFRQKRHGFNNQIIEILKFRSMYHDMSDPAARRVVTKGDPRVTRVGRFIRKSSIDELPQLWNVIRGELSLVGPRPHAVHALSSNNEAFLDIVDDYFGRHKVKPGITGWAQVNGYRGEIDQPEKLKKRFEYDLQYIETWSILFDAAIILRTPLSLLNTQNAY